MDDTSDNTDNEDYYIKQLNADKLKDLEVLYKAVYGSHLPQNYYQKKYDTAYTGASYVGFVAYDTDNTPVAYYGVLPCFIQYKDEIILAAQAVDAMTHPQHRYKKLFTKLASSTFKLCKQTGIRLIFGFPNQNSYHGHVHNLGWKVSENMERFTIPIYTFPLASLLRYFKWIQPIYIKYVNRVLHRYRITQAGLPNPVIKEEYGGVFRDEKYLQHKTYSNTQVLKVGSTKVWVRIKNDLMIGDIEMTDDDLDKVIKVLKKISKFLGVPAISFQTSIGTYMHTAFAKRYKPLPSFPIIFLNLNTTIPVNKLKFTLADIDIF
ncbi:MAG TPA: GNAT family N-acetyltransferase [Parafilimonas sp.]|nr:GNAT family N-acetyltransferase [Parafilimonas sp.]